MAKELEDLGLELAIETLEEVNEGDDWRIAESYWVRYALDHKWPVLNKVSGGDGLPLDFITDPNPERDIFRCIRVLKPTVVLLASIENMSLHKTGKKNELLHQSLVFLNLYDQQNLNYQTELAKSMLQNLPNWQTPLTTQSQDPARQFFCSVLKNGVYNTVIFMKKKTADFLDELAAKIFNGKRRGYDATWYAALQLLKDACETRFV